MELNRDYILDLEEVKRYLDSDEKSRNFLEGVKITLSKDPYIVKCGVSAQSETKLDIWSGVVRGSRASEEPRTVTGQLDIQPNSRKVTVNGFSCNCPAGEGGKCKHIAGTLLYIQSEGISQLGTISCTDIKCSWALRKKEVLAQFEATPVEEYCHVKPFSRPCRMNTAALQILQSEATHLLMQAAPQSAQAKHWRGRTYNARDIGVGAHHARTRASLPTEPPPPGETNDSSVSLQSTGGTNTGVQNKNNSVVPSTASVPECVVVDCSRFTHSVPEESEHHSESEPTFDATKPYTEFTPRSLDISHILKPKPTDLSDPQAVVISLTPPPPSQHAGAGFETPVAAARRRQTAVIQVRNERTPLQPPPPSPARLQEATDFYEFVQASYVFEELLPPCLETLSDCCQQSYASMSLGRAAAIELCAASQGSDQWKQARKFRLTGSTSYGIYTYGNNPNSKPNWPKKFETLFLKTSNFQSRAMRNGTENEHAAIVAYVNKSPILEMVNIKCFGLALHARFPLFGYSPDGIVYLSGAPAWLLEVKCPEKGDQYHRLSIREVIEQKHCPYIITQVDGDGKVSYRLKENHAYYGQIMLGLAFFNVAHCDLILYASYDRSFEVVRVYRDDTFAKQFIKRLQVKYLKNFLHLVCQNKTL